MISEDPLADHIHQILGTAGAPDRGHKHARSNFLGHAQAALTLLNQAKSQGLDISDKRIADAERRLRQAEEDMERLEAEGMY